MKKVVTLGEILVEVMAATEGHGFNEPLALRGPYPSGAPAIFIDQVAKLGHACAIIACVGNDDFGRLNIERLAADGVGTEAIEVRDGTVTGTAFVRYRGDGGRDFVFNIAGSASGLLRLTDVALALLDECGHFHLSGSSLLSPQLAEVALDAVARVKGHGGTVSLDPNLRGDAAADPNIRSALRAVLAQCDVFLPGEDELALLTTATTAEGAVNELLAAGVPHVVVKRGAAGSSYYGREGRASLPAYPAVEVDPTGAGDCFDATFITYLLQGRPAAECLDLANAAGARAVSVRGPMEGTGTPDQLEQVRAGGSAPKRLWDFATAVARSRRPAPSVPAGLTSVCSAHPVVIEAAVRQAKDDDAPVLIEATCNQVNHRGGYTGLTPSQFAASVRGIAARCGLPPERVILGGDHLGPSPWRHLPPGHALEEAAAMVDAYVSAGYQKIHLDTSMGCQGEPDHIGDQLTAARAASLAAVAEQAAARSGTAPRYVIGTEVPTPGGALHHIDNLEVTRPEAVVATYEAHRAAFAAAGVGAALERVMAIVAQPGVEFDNQDVVVYQPERAQELKAGLGRLPGLVFEAHSTDYQPEVKLAALVEDGFAILKVGPGLTFALREALYGLDAIALFLDPSWAGLSLARFMEDEMVAHPGHWQAHYHGTPDELHFLRHFSYSDRIRYYWAGPGPQEAVERLYQKLSEGPIAAPLISQYLPTLYTRVAAGTLPAEPRALALEAVRDVLRTYARACATAPASAATPSSSAFPA